MKVKQLISISLISVITLSACGSSDKPLDSSSVLSDGISQSSNLIVETPIPSLESEGKVEEEVSEPDTEAPVIHIKSDRNFYLDTAISYFSAIWVEDNVDSVEDIILSVDKSKVNTKAVGEYPVTYTATDSSGNSSTVKTTIRLNPVTVSPEVVSENADIILSNIITSSMTDEQKLFAVYYYVYNNINYCGGSRNYDKDYEIYRGLVNGNGNCFTFYACVEYLAQKLGFEVMRVERAQGTSRHYWCLVYFNDGWYHIDACNGSELGNHAFLKTADELYEIDSYYWNMDFSKYPEMADTPYTIVDDTIKNYLAENEK